MPYTKTDKLNETKSLMTLLPEKLKTFNADPITVAFVLALSVKQRKVLTLKQTLNLIKDTGLKYRAESMVTEEIYKQVQELLKTYSYEDFADFICNYNAVNDSFRQNDTTPESIVKLAIKLLEITKSDKVGDFGCGRGSFLMSASSQEPRVHYYGCEINTNAVEIAKMRALVSDADIEIQQGNIFHIRQKDFTKIFSNYPFALPLRYLGGLEYVKELQMRCPKVSTATSSDWVFNSFICDHLSAKGKGIGIMTNGSTFNTIDTPVRKYFIEQGLIEAVIALPNRLFFTTSIPTCLIVLSKGNKTIRMIDASQMYKQERRQNVLTDEHIRQIIESCSTNSAYSRQVSLKELQAQNYVLFPGKYLEQKAVVENAVTLGSLATSITRAAALRADELDALISDEPTSIQYLSSSDISHGVIAKDLPFLKELPGRCQSAQIKDNSLILTKNAPYKSAVVRVKEGQTIVASGNMYILTLDEAKANGYYVQAFLESILGQKVLAQASVGAVISLLSLKALKELPIPVCPLKEQEKIAHRYLCAQDEVAILKLQLAKAEKRVQNIWEEAQEGR